MSTPPEKTCPNCGAEVSFATRQGRVIFACNALQYASGRIKHRTPACYERQLAAKDGRIRSLEEELHQSFLMAEEGHAAEKLGGNIVKLEYWKGELAALHRMRKALTPTLTPR